MHSFSSNNDDEEKLQKNKRMKKQKFAKVSEGKLGKESSSKEEVEYEVVIPSLHLQSCE